MKKRLPILPVVFAAACLTLALAVVPLHPQVRITGTTGTGGPLLRLESPFHSLTPLIGQRVLDLGPFVLDGGLDEVRVDVQGLKLALNLETGEADLMADLLYFEAGFRGSGDLVTTVVTIEASELGSFRLELDGRPGLGLITTSSAYEAAPPPTPWRVIWIRNGSERILASGRGGAASDEPTGLGTFRITSVAHHMHNDLDIVCMRAFGAGYQLADWRAIVEAFRQGTPVDRIVPSGTVFVSLAGRRFHSQGRHYIANRSNHRPSGEYPSHDQINNYLIDLGSWYDTYPVLCYSEGSVSEPITPSATGNRPLPESLDGLLHAVNAFRAAVRAGDLGSAASFLSPTFCQERSEVGFSPPSSPIGNLVTTTPPSTFRYRYYELCYGDQGQRDQAAATGEIDLRWLADTVLPVFLNHEQPFWLGLMGPPGRRSFYWDPFVLEVDYVAGQWLFGGIRGLAVGEGTVTLSSVWRGSPGTTSTHSADFALTSPSFRETDDLVTGVRRELGGSYAVADWNDIAGGVRDVDGWLSSLGVAQNEMILVTFNGQRFLGGRRHYFLQRGTPHVGAAVHARFGQTAWLGSWYGYSNLRVLAVRR